MRPSWKRCESPRVLPRLVRRARGAAPLVLDEAVAVAVAPLVDPARAPRSAGSLQLAARARRRRSSARPRRAGRGRAASRRPCRSTRGTSARRPCPCRTSWTIFPGSASIAGRPRVACSSASTSSAVRASSGPNSSVCRHVISVSRPKTVMNHGIPAAGSVPSRRPCGCAATARSATERLKEWRRSSQSRGAAARAAARPRAIAHVHELLAEAPLAPSRRIWSPSRSAMTSMRSSTPRAAPSSTCQRDVEPSTAPGCERITCVRAPAVRSTNTNWLCSASKSAAPAAAAAARVGVAEREVVLLDREDVREVAAEREADLERERLHRSLRITIRVLHAVADEALPRDRQRVLRKAARGGLRR